MFFWVNPDLQAQDAMLHMNSPACAVHLAVVAQGRRQAKVRRGWLVFDTEAEVQKCPRELTSRRLGCHV